MKILRGVFEKYGIVASLKYISKIEGLCKISNRD
jgi:hypothetical protein